MYPDMRSRRTRSITNFKTIAITTATASRQSRRTNATNRPTPVPTTKLPSCIGTQSGQYNQSGRRFTARNTRCSRGSIAGRRAPANDPPSTTTPTAAATSAPRSVTLLAPPGCDSGERRSRSGRLYPPPRVTGFALDLRDVAVVCQFTRGGGHRRRPSAMPQSREAEQSRTEPRGRRMCRPEQNSDGDRTEHETGVDPPTLSDGHRRRSLLRPPGSANARECGAS